MTDLRIEEVGAGHRDDLGVLLDSDQASAGCWCMWFLIPVKEYHAGKRASNRIHFENLVTKSDHPAGLLAYLDDRPVGWCAVGPRARYARAVRTPTMKGRRGDDSDVWLVPCLMIHPDHRGGGIATVLLTAAVDLAERSGATAIEGFPLAGDKRRSRGSDLMTGVESLFEQVGFAVDHRPSNNRVIMRQELNQQTSGSD